MTNPTYVTVYLEDLAGRRTETRLIDGTCPTSAILTSDGRTFVAVPDSNPPVFRESRPAPDIQSTQCPFCGCGRIVLHPYTPTPYTFHAETVR